MHDREMQVSLSDFPKKMCSTLDKMLFCGYNMTEPGFCGTSKQPGR